MGLTYRIYLSGNRIFGCGKCKTHLSTSEHIMSKGGEGVHIGLSSRPNLTIPTAPPNQDFHGKTGRAYLFEDVVNVTDGPQENREMRTGLHTVVDIHCCHCGFVVGWKYLRDAPGHRLIISPLRTTDQSFRRQGEV
ncbi:hypothetical protein BC938DRAFT_480133 [Jimgerdemannia flammicorona]|uniref:Protein yippee-like n=1 Tax=Jimgerdemannia flammicorona TaxID=994334 RepID=A0A433QJB8_9FUNG|nr:hypothetical protein BC938DRAFT_480133 [Jimgerdemannia flammicorona]